MDVALETERGTQIRMEQLSDVSKNSQCGSVVGDSCSEMGAWMPVKSENLIASHRASSFSRAPGSSQGELLVEVHQEAKCPSADTTRADTIHLEKSLEDICLVGDKQITGSLGVSPKSPSGEAGNAPGVLLDGPILFDVDSSISKIEVNIERAREGLAVEFGD